MAWLTIDAGTSVIKSVVFADNGRELSIARERTTVLHPQQGWSEQDMHEVWAAVVSTVRQAAAASQEPLRGIVSTAQGDGCWLVDEAGEPTGNAILWNDGRAAALVEQWTQEGLVEETFRRCGSVTYAGLPSAILAWLHRHQPERVQRSRWTLTCNGWLMAKMTGRFVADPSDSANPFCDLSTGGYCEATLAGYGLAPDAHRLPPIAKGLDVVWPLCNTAAAAFGVPAGTPVVMAPYDIVTTAYGSGAAHVGQACVILGTTICAEVLQPSFDRQADPMGTTLPLYDGLYLRAMPTLTGCEALEWAVQALDLEGLPALDELARGASHTGQRISFLPYLSLAGERSPFLAPEATGSFHGLTLATSRGELARAVYEGLSFVVRECLQAACGDIAFTEVRVCGGGARSDFWCQLIADVLGVPVIRPGDAENGARGAYLFALVATGEAASVAAAADRHVSIARTFLPAAEVSDLYNKRFAIFRNLRETSMQQWRAMARAR